MMRIISNEELGSREITIQLLEELKETERRDVLLMYEKVKEI